jgi:curved DNA-binding protein CbpA
MLPDYYFVLGIPFHADLQTIKIAYRAKAIVSHPDHGGSHEAMLQINEAYGILANPDARRHYDEARANQYNQTAQQQAQADASQAQQQAEQYPRQWTDFESWLAKDFTEAEYGNWGSIPTAGKSASGVLFIIIGLVVGIAAACALTESGILASGTPAVMVVVMGGFLGQWVHKQIGKSMRM